MRPNTRYTRLRFATVRILCRLEILVAPVLGGACAVVGFVVGWFVLAVIAVIALIFALTVWLRGRFKRRRPLSDCHFVQGRTSREVATNLTKDPRFFAKQSHGGQPV